MIALKVIIILLGSNLASVFERVILGSVFFEGAIFNNYFRE